MSNYLSGVVQSNFGDKKVTFATLISDDGAVGAISTGYDEIDFVALSPTTEATYTPRYTLSGGSLTIVTAASGTSFKVMIVGR